MRANNKTLNSFKKKKKKKRKTFKKDQERVTLEPAGTGGGAAAPARPLRDPDGAAACGGEDNASASQTESFRLRKRKREKEKRDPSPPAGWEHRTKPRALSTSALPPAVCRALSCEDVNTALRPPEAGSRGARPGEVGGLGCCRPGLGRRASCFLVFSRLVLTALLNRVDSLTSGPATLEAGPLVPRRRVVSCRVWTALLCLVTVPVACFSVCLPRLWYLSKEKK